MVWLAGRGKARTGKARKGRQGMARLGAAWRGKAGKNGWPRMANKDESVALAQCRVPLRAACVGLKGARGKRKTYQLTRQSAQLTVHGIVWRDEDDASSEGLRIL